MMRVVVVMVGCFVAVAQAASVKKRNDNWPNYDVNETTIDTSQIMGDINEAASTYDSIMRWVQDWEQSLGDQLNAGMDTADSSLPLADMSAIQSELDGIMAEYSSYMKEMEKMAKQMRTDAIQRAGIAKRNIESAGYPVGEMPNFGNSVPDFSAMFNGNMGEGSEGMPHGIPDFSAMFNGNPGANQGSPDFSNLIHNTNPGTNPELAQTIENFNKEMEKQMKAIGEEMMRNLERLGLNAESQPGKR